MLSFAWPLIHLTIAILRFGQGFTGGFGEALVFLPMGAISGGLLLYLLDLAETRQQKLLTAGGYLMSSPMAFIGSLGGGLILPPIIGASLIGGLALAVGALFGYNAGRFFAKGKG